MASIARLLADDIASTRYAARVAEVWRTILKRLFR
jgi:hypothetical protein